MLLLDEFVCLFSKALALEHVPYLWMNICISLDLFGFVWIFRYIYIYIYDVFSSMYIVF